jgi:hypothetical protein
MSVNAGQKINKRRHGCRTFKHRAKQAVGTIFNLYDKDRNKKKKAPAVVYDPETSDDEDNHSDDKIYKSPVKEVKKRRWKDNHHSLNQREHRSNKSKMLFLNVIFIFLWNFCFLYEISFHIIAYPFFLFSFFFSFFSLFSLFFPLFSLFLFFFPFSNNSITFVKCLILFLLYYYVFIIVTLLFFVIFTCCSLYAYLCTFTYLIYNYF